MEGRGARPFDKRAQEQCLHCLQQLQIAVQCSWGAAKPFQKVAALVLVHFGHTGFEDSVLIQIHIVAKIAEKPCVRA